MKNFTTLLVLCLFTFRQMMAQPVSQKPFHIYAPTTSSKKLLIINAIPSADGLELKLESEIELLTPISTILKHPAKPLLYLAGNKKGFLVTLNQDGSYQKHDPIIFENPYAFIGLDRSNHFLLAVDYRGSLDIYSLNDDGVPITRVSHKNEGKMHLHCITTSPDNHFVYTSYVREINTIREYRFDPNSGNLSALFPESVNLPNIIGPRHLVWHPTKPILYSSNEQNPGASAFDWHQDGHLSLRQSCAALEVKDQGGDSTASDIVITPDAKFLFVGIRGTAPIPDSIARYQIGEAGDLRLLGHTSVDKMPWGFSLSPDGGYLMVTAWVGATLSAFRIDEKGDLQKVGGLTTEKNIYSVTTR